VGGVTFAFVLFLHLLAWTTGAEAATQQARRHVRTTKPRISLTVPIAAEPLTRIAVKGTVTAAPHGARVILWADQGPGRLNLGATKVTAGGYRIAFEVPRRESTLSLRTALVSGRHTLATSSVRTLRILSAFEAEDRTGGDAPWPPAKGGQIGEQPKGTPERPQSPEPIQVTAAEAVVKVGSAIQLAIPGPIKSITELDPPSESRPGLGIAVVPGGLEMSVSASASAVPGASVIRATGVGCTEIECGRPLALTVPVTVTSLPAPPGPIEKFTEPSPDRVTNAVDDALADELLLTLGTAQQPGDRAEAETDANAVGGTITGGIEAIGVYEVRWGTPQDLGARRAALEALSGVAAVSSYSLAEFSADAVTDHMIAPGYDQTWWTWPREQIDAEEAWDRAGGSPVTVGVIDGGDVFSGHEDLHVSETIPTGVPIEAHATHVAGLACARGDNQVGMTGMEPGCPLVSYGIGGIRGFFAHVLEGMTKMAERPAVKVVNISLGENAELGPHNEHQCATSFEAEQFQAHAEDAAPMFHRLLAGIGSEIVWTFSAGNNCTPGIPSPWGQSSDLANVIVVAATNSDGNLASFSDYGRRIDIAAPGGVETAPPSSAPDPSKCTAGSLCFGQIGLLSSVVSCAPHCAGGYEEMAGTSMSAPLVAGVAALIRSTNPSLSAAEAGECIKVTAGLGTGYANYRSSLPTGFIAKFSTPSWPAIPILDANAAIECALPEAGGEPGPPAGPEVVSVDYQGVARTGHDPRISRDGRYVWFESADNLVPGIRLEASAVYIRDLVAKTTRRIDLPGANHQTGEELLAISPSGRYALVGFSYGSIPYLVDQQTGSITQVSRFLGYPGEFGLEDDGDTVLKAPSEPTPGSNRGNVADLYSISKDEWTSLPCPIERYNREDIANVNLDNSGFAGVASYGCRSLSTGYVINLATNAVDEVIPGFCNNLGNVCVEALAANETGSTYFASLCCADLQGSSSLDFDGRRLGEPLHDVHVCGVSESGRYAIYGSAGVIYAYDDVTKGTTPLTESTGGGNYASCWRQSVTSGGTVVYTRQFENEWAGSQILLAHP
jgi:subtilisin family serine protease